VRRGSARHRARASTRQCGAQHACRESNHRSNHDPSLFAAIRLTAVIRACAGAARGGDSQ
jgi:hypothetical protein